MPSIMKNGQQFGGVPIEVITAWEPTGDPVQVAQPLMGNTDISSIGNGTVTGAVSSLSAGLTDVTTGVIADSSVTNTGTYYVKAVTKFNNKVHVKFSAVYGTGQGGGVELGKLPIGFRPISQVTVPAFIKTSSGITNGAAVIQADGVIQQGFTGSCLGIMIDTIIITA